MVWSYPRIFEVLIIRARAPLTMSTTADLVTALKKNSRQRR